MKTVVIYNSQTGFTKRYAEWIADALDADICSAENGCASQKTTEFLFTTTATPDFLVKKNDFLLQFQGIASIFQCVVVSTVPEIIKFPGRKRKIKDRHNEILQIFCYFDTGNFQLECYAPPFCR